MILIGLYLKVKNFLFKAAVLKKKSNIDIIKLQVPILEKGQVLIKNHYAGICHTQLLEFRGKRGVDKYLPHCLGHESSATVIDVGPGVKKIKPSDNVIASWISGNGLNAKGPAYKSTSKNTNVNAGPIAVFSEYSVVSENRLYKIPSGLSIKDAVFYGCAIPTGMGSIRNYLNDPKNDKICVIGAGGVGTFASIAASLLGCKNLLVIDVNKKKLKIPKKLGFDTFDISDTNKNKNFYNQNANMFELVIECTGNIEAMSNAINLCKPKLGKLIMNGNAPYGKKLLIDPLQFNMGKTIIGSWGGNSDLDRDIKFYSKISKKLKINLSSNFNDFYSLDDVEKAFEDLETGKSLRPIIRF